MNSPVSAHDELWLRSRFAEARTVKPVTEGDGHLWQRDREIRSAAVLVPVVKRKHGLTVLFTRRTAHLNDHAGQISFPGGRSEPGDADAAETALREAAEEIGLAAAQVEVLGELPEYVTVTGYRVTPVVGLVTPPPLSIRAPRALCDLPRRAIQCRRSAARGHSLAAYGAAPGVRRLARVCGRVQGQPFPRAPAQRRGALSHDGVSPAQPLFHRHSPCAPGGRRRQGSRHPLGLAPGKLRRSGPRGDQAPRERGSAGFFAPLCLCRDFLVRALAGTGGGGGWWSPLSFFSC